MRVGYKFSNLISIRNCLLAVSVLKADVLFRKLFWDQGKT